MEENKDISRTFTIAKVKTDGKWMEFWFKEVSKENPKEYYECCKQYMLYDLVESSNLSNRVLNRGFKGLEIEWPKGSDRPTGLRIKKPNS